MLTQDQLRELIATGEADRLERTISIGNTQKFCEAVCAFANDLPGHRLPGYLLIGIEDAGGVAGLTVADELLQNLGAIRSDGNVLPQPVLSVYKVALPEGEVAVVEVQPSDLPPVRYKGRTYVRVGPRKGVASEQEERLLSERRIATAKSFDAQPCRESTLSDLASSLFEGYRTEAVAADVVAENRRSIEQQLASLRFYDDTRGHPTHAGLLLFGANPRYFLPGAYVQYLRLPAADLTDIPDDQAEISGDLLGVLRELETRLRTNIRTTMRATSAARETLLPDYPESALRELLMNAIMHRDYQSNTPVRFYWFSTHVEIQSPGGLFGEATRENFPTRNSYRNPVVAEAMKSLGYVNRFGYGVQRAQALLEKNGNPPAAFEFDPHSVVVKVYRRAP